MTLLLGVCETATVWVIANYHPCIFERTLTTDIIAANGAESRLEYISDDLYARQENILLMRDKERLVSVVK